MRPSAACTGAPDGAIVLAGEHWHQGVVGIVASRLSEEFCRPTFLICLDGERGKASSRSYGGFNLFASLTELSGLLEGYGGHELAARVHDCPEEYRRLPRGHVPLRRGLCGVRSGGGHAAGRL